MVAGATGVDLYLMVVAADDGVMPQTVEHAAVLAGAGRHPRRGGGHEGGPGRPRARGTRRRPELMAGRGALQVVTCSARTGEGRRCRRGRAGSGGRRPAGPRRERRATPLLHIDRSFTIHGAGTVVTGTLWSGSVGRGDVLMLLPAGRQVRVRGVQVHDRAGRARRRRPARGAQPGGRRSARHLPRGRARRSRDRRTDHRRRRGAVAARRRARDARARPPRHARGAGAPRGAGRRPLAAAPGAAAAGARRRPRRRALAGAARHARRRRGARPRARRHGRRADVLARLERLRRGEPEPEPEPRRRAARGARAGGRPAAAVRGGALRLEAQPACGGP